MKTKEKADVFKCQVCDRHFSSRNSLKVHTDCHEKLKKYDCKHCGALFHTQGSYYSHIRKHNGNAIICHYCGKTFYHNDKFKCHLRIHTGERPFVCKHCPKKFASRDNLKRHDVLVHKNDNDYCCGICTEKFVFYQNYLDHLKSHKLNKCFKCDLCKKTVMSKSLLLRHMRIHTGKKPYKCETCSASFSDSSNKKRHMKTHKTDGAKKKEEDDGKIAVADWAAGELTCDAASGQVSVKPICILGVDVKSSQMKLLILFNDRENGAKLQRASPEQKMASSCCDYLTEPVKPGKFIEDCMIESCLKFSLFE